MPHKSSVQWSLFRADIWGKADRLARLWPHSWPASMTCCHSSSGLDSSQGTCRFQGLHYLRLFTSWGFFFFFFLMTQQTYHYSSVLMETLFCLCWVSWLLSGRGVSHEWFITCYLSMSSAVRGLLQELACLSARLCGSRVLYLSPISLPLRHTRDQCL